MKVFGKVHLLIAAVMCLNLGGCATQAALAAFRAVGDANTKAYIDRENSLQAGRTYGTKIDPEKVSQIKDNVTTRSQVEALFGPPQNVSMMGDGRRMMIYTYYSTSERNTLQIILNSANVVQDHEYNINKNVTGTRGSVGNTGVSTTSYPDGMK